MLSDKTNETLGNHDKEELETLYVQQSYAWWPSHVTCDVINDMELNGGTQ